MRLDPQLLAYVDDDGFEAAVRVGVEDAGFKLLGGADGLETDFDCCVYPSERTWRVLGDVGGGKITRSEYGAGRGGGGM
jgi:hypothetical protein